MHKIMIGMFVFVVFQAFANGQSIEKKYLKKALIVGVEDYKGKENDLKGVSFDIKLMKKLFEGENFQVKILKNKKSLNLQKQLDLYGRELSSDDSFIFYYSGHGSHKKDINGDESDGQDEMIVLSDGKKNIGLLDDILHHYFSKIQAKKLIIFDSCYSGTVSKSFNDNFQVKSIPPKLITDFFPRVKNLFKNREEYIILSSSQDNETSLSSNTGSLFTKYFVEAFSEHKSESFSSLMNRVRKRLLFFCLKKNYIPKHPKIQASNESLKEKSFEGYFILP